MKELEVDENSSKSIEYDGKDWIYIVLEVEKCRVFESTVLKLRIA